MLMTSIVYFTVAVKYVRQPLSQDCTLDAKDVYLTFLSNVVSHLWEHIYVYSDLRLSTSSLVP